MVSRWMIEYHGSTDCIFEELVSSEHLIKELNRTGVWTRSVSNRSTGPIRPIERLCPLQSVDEVLRDHPRDGLNSGCEPDVISSFCCIRSVTTGQTTSQSVCNVHAWSDGVPSTTYGHLSGNSDCGIVGMGSHSS